MNKREGDVLAGRPVAGKGALLPNKLQRAKKGWQGALCLSHYIMTSERGSSRWHHSVF